MLTRAADHHIEHFGLGAEDVIYVPSPLAHQTGFLYGMWIAIRLGVPQVLQEVWDAEVGLDDDATLRRHASSRPRPRSWPTSRGWPAERGETPEGLQTFVATGAAIPRELARRSREVLGAEVGGAWGTTESCLGCAFAPGDPPELAWGSDGRALSNVRLRIVDDEGRPLGTGEEGNFEVHTDCLFQGYLNRPELTAEAVTADGWYRTGDLARIDAHGYVRITGRVKDVINRGGEKVPVAEIEQLLHAHPAVRDVAIVAMPDERLGERACAFVVSGDGLDFETMLDYLDSARVAKTYWPERLELVESLPRTPSGKIQKFVLRPRAGRSRTESTDMTTADYDFDALQARGPRATSRTEGERWAELIEREHRVPLELWDELRDRGYLRLAAPLEYGGRGHPVHALPRAARAVLDVARARCG